ncbi:hypothetical protein TWF225_002851 [Orbilia oligospora]|nr:hypothetical protein TWF225_002851 [Orbilia oligospora]
MSSSEDPEYRAIQDHTENDDIEGLVSSSSCLQNHELSPNVVTEASAGPSYPPQFSSNDEVPTLCSGPFSSEVISGTEGASIEILRRSNSNYDHVDEFWYAFALSSPIPNLQDPPGPALSDNGSSSSSSDGSTPKSDSGLNTESTTPASSPAASRTSLSPRDETLDTPASPPVALGADLPPRDETLATPDDSPYIPLDLTRYALEQYQAAENATANAPEYTFRKTAERNPSPEGFPLFLCKICQKRIMRDDYYRNHYAKSPRHKKMAEQAKALGGAGVKKSQGKKKTKAAGRR